MDFYHIYSTNFSNILCEILASNNFSKKKLKFDKEITEAKMLKYVVMNCSCEFLATQ